MILGLFLGGREDLGAWDTAPLNEKARNGEEKKSINEIPNDHEIRNPS